MNGDGVHNTTLWDEPAEKEMSLHDIIQILLTGKWIIVATFSITLLSVAFYTFTQDPSFEASSIIYVNNEESAPQLGELIGPNMNEAVRNIATEVEIIKSLSSARRVAEVLLTEDEYMSNYETLAILHTESGAGVDLEQLAGRLSSRITARPVSTDVDLIVITARSTVPEEAQLIANLYAQTYRDYNLRTSRERMTASREFLDEIAGTFSMQLQQAEDDLTAFLNEERIVEPDAEARQLLEQISALQELGSQTQLQLGVAQAELKSLENEVERIAPGLAEQISSSDDLVIDQLKQQIANLQVEEQQIFASHPARRSQLRTGRLAQIEQELNELTGQLDMLVKRMVDQMVQANARDATSSAKGGSSSTAGVINAVENLRSRITDKIIQISGLQVRLNIANEQLETFKVQLAQIPAKSVILQRLQRSQRAQEQLYLALLDELQQARIAEQSEVGSIKIVDEAGVPSNPVSPRIPQNLIFGTVFGLLLGIGFAFIRNAFDDKIRSPEDLQAYNLPVLGIIPRYTSTKEVAGGKPISMGEGKYDVGLVGLRYPISAATEAYRALRINVQFSRHGTRAKTIVVAGPEPGDGKTVTALNLAILLAQTGARTVFIDSDLHRPSGHRKLDVTRDPGLTDVLRNTSPWDVSGFKTDIDNFTFIPAGGHISNSAEMLGSTRMQSLFAYLRQQFDFIIIDTPPLLAVIDAVILASMSDTTLFVCAANKSHKQATGRAIETLRKVDAPIAGIVLNRFDAVRAFGTNRYSHHYGYGDYGYNGSGAPGAEQPGRQKKGVKTPVI